MKTCFKCKEEKLFKEFQKCSSNKDGLHSWCRPCVNTANFGYKLKSRYGMTVEDRQKMISDRGGHCDICKTQEPGGKGWCLDHDHKTGLVRGILCPTCNYIVGHIENGLNLYIPAVEQYLKFYSQQQGGGLNAIRSA